MFWSLIHTLKAPYIFLPKIFPKSISKNSRPGLFVIRSACKTSPKRLEFIKITSCGTHVQLSSSSFNYLTPLWRKPLPYRNQSIDLLCKSMDWFLYGKGLCHERDKLTKKCYSFTDGIGSPNFAVFLLSEISPIKTEAVVYRCSSIYVFLKIS